MMRSLNLGIDFDGVITDPTELKAIWVKNNFNIDLLPEQTVKHQAIPLIGKDGYNQMIKQCYAGQYSSQNKIRSEAIKFLHALIQQNYKIYIITSRQDDELVKAVELLEHYQVPYHEVYNTSYEPKDGLCRKYDIGVFLDDTQSKLAQLTKINGIKLVFFNVFAEQLSGDYYEVKSWLEFYNLVKSFAWPAGQLA